MELPVEVKTIIEKFAKATYQLYLVGGGVRDLMLQKAVKDFDFTTDAKPEEILELLPEGHYNNQYGTVGIPLTSNGTPQTAGQKNAVSGIVEITTMRREGEYKDSRHPNEISWTNKIEEDLKRRDFTINAMAIPASVIRVGSNDQNPEILSSHTPQNDHLVDPFNGKQDLENNLIRAVGDPNKRFEEDALRLMRAIRFATQLDFQIEEETYESVAKNAQLLKNISSERIRDELLKILAADKAYEGIILLKETGLLEYIIPELNKCFGVVQEGPNHERIYDIGTHSLMSLKFCPSSDPVVRFAALVHDIGKPNTYRVDSTGNVTFYHHEVVGAKIAGEIARRLNFSNKEIEKIVSLVRWHMFSVDENQTDSAIRRSIKNMGLENVEDMMAIREADRLGGGTATPTSWRLERFKDRIKEVLTQPFSIKDLKVNGQDVMSVLQIPPSRKVGEILEKLFQEVSEDGAKNTREYLLNRLPKLK